MGKSDQKNQQGFMLAQLVIIIPLVGIISLVLASMMSSMFTQVGMLSQRLEARELQSQLTQFLADDNRCGEVLQNRSVNVTGVTTTRPSQSSVRLNEIKVGGSNGVLLAKAGAPLSSVPSSLRVQDILLTNILSTGQPDEFAGTIRIIFDPASEKTPSRPVEITRLFRVEPTDPAASKRIIACVGGVGNDILGIKKCVSRTVAGGNSNRNNNRGPASTQTVTCPGSEQLLGCFGYKNPVFPQPEVGAALAHFSTTGSIVNLPQGRPGHVGGLVSATAQAGLCTATGADSIILICCE